MGICIYCGKKAGLFKNKHEECVKQNLDGKKEIINSVKMSIIDGKDKSDVSKKINHIAANSYINDGLKKDLVVKGWEEALESFLNDDFLDKSEEKKLTEAMGDWDLTQNELDINGNYTRLFQSSVLREVLDGDIPERINVKGNIPFNFQKDEKLVWVFQDVNYYEDKTRRQYVGGYHGASVRVAKGLYYRVGSFRGSPVETTETVHVSTGILGVTNKHLYYHDGVKPFRIKYDKIISIEPKADGITIQREGVTAKPQSFVLGDGWFIYNLISNLSNM